MRQLDETRSMLQDVNAEKLTQAIVAMGNALKMSIVAEGGKPGSR